MLRRIVVTALAALVLLAAVSAGNAAAPQAAPPHNATKASPYHRPQTAPEKALDAFLVLSIKSDANLDYYLMGVPYYEPRKDTGYARLVTPALRSNMSRQQAAAAQRDCGGKYEDGEVCGFDFSLSICGQDYPDYYFYRTISQTADTAEIATNWPGDTADLAFYRLILRHGHWKVDGIDCPGLGKFNMK